MITRQWFQFVAGTAALVALSACDASVSMKSDGEETEAASEASDDVHISFSSDGEDSEGEGKGRSAISFDIEGFSLDIDVPEINLDASDVDVNDADLYPGSKLTGIDIRASDRKGSDEANVVLSFDAPAAPDAVADWFEKRFEEENFDIGRTGNRLTGKTDEGDDLTLDIEAAGTDKSKGRLVIRESS